MKKQIALGILALTACGFLIGTGAADAHSRCRGPGWGGPRWGGPPAWGWNNPNRNSYGYGRWHHQGYDGYRRVANNPWRDSWQRGPGWGYNPGYGGGNWHPSRW